jgi:hypothetical protein
VRAIFNTSVWLQAGWYLALAAQIPAEQKSGCPRLRLENPLGHGNFLSGLKLSGERDGGLGFGAVLRLAFEMAFEL